MVMNLKDIAYAQNNILLAEFIGYRFDITDTSWYITKPNEEDWYFGAKIKDLFTEHVLNELDFLNDWNLLMQVVDKIESIYHPFHGYFGVYVCSNSCTIQGTRLNTSLENPHYAYFNEFVLNTKIESTYFAIVQFINWYNENILITS